MSEPHQILRYVVKDINAKRYLRKSRSLLGKGEEWDERIEDSILFDSRMDATKEIGRHGPLKRSQLAPVPVYLTLVSG